MDWIPGIDLFSLIVCLCVLAGVLVVAAAVYLNMTSSKPNLKRLQGEGSFVDPKQGNKRCPFPRIDDPPTKHLSVIVPAYNETERMPVMLNETIEYLSKKKNPRYTYEIIIVDDGSTDKTTETGLLYSEKYGTDAVRVLTLSKNRGKGGAVRMGMLSARGKFLLFADADGATKFADVAKLEEEMENINKEDNGMAIVCGSRAHLQDDSIAQRSAFRTLLMYGFHLVVMLCVRGIKDTQCGFKLLSRPAAQLIFHNQHVERWAFDVDLLYIARHFNMPIGEVAVNWTEIEGSKLSPFWATLQMGRDLILIRLRYMLGIWAISDKPKRE